MNWGSQASAPTSRQQTIRTLKYEAGARLYSQASAVPPGRNNNIKRNRSIVPAADGTQLGTPPQTGYDALRSRGLSPLDGIMDQSLGRNGKENKQNLKKDIKTFISKLNRKKFETG